MKKKTLFLGTAAALVLVFVLIAVLQGPKIKDKGMELLYPREYEDLVRREAGEFGLEAALVFAVIRTESGFDAAAESAAGACGLMQLTEQTFRWMAGKHPPENGGENIFDPGDNIHCGCAILRRLLDHYGDLTVALCAYNAGMGNVSGWLSGGEYSDDGETLHTIPYPETAAYVEKVTRAMERYETLYGL